VRWRSAGRQRRSVTVISMPSSRATTLYRLSDAEGALLYVGIAYDALRRLRQHARKAPWYREVARIELEAFPTREDAAAAEERAVREEGPRHNIRLRPLREIDRQTAGVDPKASVDVDELVRRTFERIDSHLEGMSSLEQCRDLTILREIFIELRDAEVAAAVREEAASWSAIARATGMSRQGARKRYGHLEVVS
jgi:predicted GIY-YIG superfamily endonuclease